MTTTIVAVRQGPTETGEGRECSIVCGFSRSAPQLLPGYFAVTELQVAASPSASDRSGRQPSSASRERGVEHAPVQVAEPCVRMLGMAVDAGYVAERGVERQTDVSIPVPTLKTPPSWPAAASTAERRRRRRRSRASARRRRRSARLSSPSRSMKIATTPPSASRLARAVDVAEAQRDVVAPWRRFQVARYSSPASFDVPYGESGCLGAVSGAGPSHSP